MSKFSYFVLSKNIPLQDCNLDIFKYEPSNTINSGLIPTGSNLTSASLTSADLTSASLTSVDSKFADLTSASLTSANSKFAFNSYNLEETSSISDLSLDSSWLVNKFSNSNSQNVNSSGNSRNGHNGNSRNGHNIIARNSNIDSRNKLKKKIIPKHIKTLIWNKYIGEDIIKHRCLCCKKETIKITDFEAGHVLSEFHGGTNEIENLRPICRPCNSSMGTTHMVEYIKMYGLYI